MIDLNVFNLMKAIAINLDDSSNGKGLIKLRFSNGSKDFLQICYNPVL